MTNSILNLGGQVPPDYNERYYFGGWVDGTHGYPDKTGSIPAQYQQYYANGYKDGLAERPFLNPVID